MSCEFVALAEHSAVCLQPELVQEKINQDLSISIICPFLELANLQENLEGGQWKLLQKELTPLI